MLLLEGEEVIGAQQNRTFDVSVLVGPGAKLRVPVSCVEAGSLGRLAPPRVVLARASDRVPRAAPREVAPGPRAGSRGMEARAEQGEVWDEVAAKSHRLDIDSSTGAMHDIYEQRRDRLSRMREAIRLHDGQAGTLVAIGGRLAVLDLVSDPDAFAVLHGPLVQGYALDALEHESEGDLPAPPRRPRAGSRCWSVTAGPRSAREASGSARSCASPPTGSRARPWSTTASWST